MMNIVGFAPLCLFHINVSQIERFFLQVNDRATTKSGSCWLMLENPFKIYENAERIGLTGRKLEASVLSRAALQLKKCLNQWEDDSHHKALVEALEYNQRLWCVFQAELSRPDNPLPVPLKEQPLSLSLYIDKCSLHLIASPDKEKLESIININLNIAAGLRGSIEEEI